MSNLAMRSRTSASNLTDGSRTVTLEEVQPRQEDLEASAEDSTAGTLRLHGGPRSQQRVAWVEETVDNESLGRKKTKICCIYHKPKKFDESSDEESSDSDSDSSCDGHHPHDHNHVHARRHRDEDAEHVHTIQHDEQEVNAYERLPKEKGKGKGKCTDN